MSHIVYLSSARLPTQNANGYQVMKMCEGMAALGHDVELMHPWRHQGDISLADADPFAYYGIERNFRLRTLPNWDLIRIERHVPVVPFRVMYAVHQLSWGLMGSIRAARRKPDLIYTRSASFAYWATRLGPPCAFEAHLLPSRVTTRLIRSFSRRKSMRAVFALTGYAAGALETVGVPPGKLEVLPDAADLDAFADMPSKEDARARLGLPSDRPIIGYVGRFKTMGKEKGVRDLVSALTDPELRELKPLLVCVGGPMDLVPDFMELARSLEIPESQLRFVDRVPNPEVPTWLAAVDVAAMPAPAASANGASAASVDRYSNATSPLKLFEYMAAGLPFVAPDIAGVREVVEDGKGCLIAPPGDSAAIGRALNRLLRDPEEARRLGEGARAAVARHSWRGRAERALDSALNGVSPR